MTDEAENKSGSEGKKRFGAVEVHNILRDRICLLEYAPGAMLRETEIASEFRISRTPVREALQRLSIEGLVEARNGVGTFVTVLDVAQLCEVFELRIEMAQMFGRLNARDACASDILLLESLLARTEGLANKFDAAEHWRINHSLHYAISDLLSNGTFLEMWHMLYFRAARVWYDMSRDIWPDAVRLLNLEITDLITAVRENDLEAVGFVKRNYIKFSWKRISQRRPL